jgi:hypothetical protein
VSWYKSNLLPTRSFSGTIVGGKFNSKTRIYLLGCKLSFSFRFRISNFWSLVFFLFNLDRDLQVHVRNGKDFHLKVHFFKSLRARALE